MKREPGESITIEAGVPLPKRGYQHKFWVDTLSRMRPGESFLFKKQHRFSITDAARVTGLLIVIRQLKLREHLGYARCWLVGPDMNQETYIQGLEQPDVLEPANDNPYHPKRK